MNCCFVYILINNHTTAVSLNHIINWEHFYWYFMLQNFDKQLEKITCKMLRNRDTKWAIDLTTINIITKCLIFVSTIFSLFIKRLDSFTFQAKILASLPGRQVSLLFNPFPMIVTYTMEWNWIYILNLTISTTVSKLKSSITYHMYQLVKWFLKGDEMYDRFMFLLCTTGC